MFQLVLIPIIVAVITQAIKLITDDVPKNFNLDHLIRDYGGMPSSHTALVASLATVIGLSAGFNSPAFAVAFVLMTVVIRDAVGFRREIGRNAMYTNIIAQRISKKSKTQYLNERIGHTVPQAIIGFIVGVGLTIILYWAFSLI